MQLLNLEIFSGSAGFQKVSRSLGIECLSVDVRRRKGICEPNIKIDLNKVSGPFFNSLNPFCIWFGLPCDIWSYASGGFHLDKDFNPKTEKAKIHLNLFYKTIQIIQESKPKYWFIENPRGKLRNYPGLTEFLKNYPGHIKECTLSSYGFPTIKPTNIITNYGALKLKPLDSYGRGNKNKDQGTFDNLTKVQRQKTPELLYKHILKQILIEEKIL